MIFDSERQRKFIIDLMAQVNYPGSLLDEAYTVKQAILKASIQAPSEAANASQLFDKQVGDT